MKYIKYLAIIVLSASTLFAQDSSEVAVSIKNWSFKVVHDGHLYPTYLADPLAPKMEGSIQNIIQSDIHFEDEVNDGGDYSNKFFVNTGSKITLFSFTNKNNLDLAIGFETGVSIPLYMEAQGFDFMAVDGIFHFAIAGSITEYLNFRLTKHHICSHRGDEYSRGRVNTPVDFDPNFETIYVRDDYNISLAYKPLLHLIHENFDFLQIYGDFIFFWPGVDFLGERLNKPERYAYLGYQGGIELEYYFKNKLFGGVYSAFNVSTYQANGYSTNLNFVSGYILPQEENKRKVRIGFQYYDGRGILNEFYSRHEKFSSFFVAVDI